MNLMLSGDAANQVLAMTRNNTRLARILARQLLTASDRATLAAYLVTDDIAVDLLTKRIAADPQKTLLEFQKLAAGRSAKQQPHGQARTPARSAKRVHMSSAQVTEIKTRVQALLRARGPSSRKQLWRAVKFPSLASYDRIMGELRADHVVTSKGDRSKTVYLLATKAIATGKLAKKSRSKAATKEAGAAKAAKDKPAKNKPAKNRPAKNKPAKNKPKSKPAKNKPAKNRPAKNKPAKNKPAKNKPAKTSPGKIKDGAKTVRKTRAPLLCPYPNCQNKAAPVFGMMCSEHKDVPVTEREQYFAARRAAAQAT